ncbi:MAG: hypothetical protein MJ062_04840 [Oscillospiraceae bacterium]|nr:hypothetical protein [Oscillospiraceae bacterium]
MELTTTNFAALSSNDMMDIEGGKFSLPSKVEVLCWAATTAIGFVSLFYN